MSSPLVIAESNLSVAWGKAFLAAYDAGEVAPLVVVIDGLDDRDPPENRAIRDALDGALEADGGGLSCGQVANTIFPMSLWNSERSRCELYRRYNKILPRIRKHRRNRNGVYFQRLISYGDNGMAHGDVNQLDHIIKTWNSGNHRRTALQASLFDPHRDHTDQRQRGFPCLQQVAFARVGIDGLSVTGFYATQYMFQRAYGNYLGLCQLGQFMAHEMNLRLQRMVCIATPAMRGGTKGRLSVLASRVEEALACYP